MLRSRGRPRGCEDKAHKKVSEHSSSSRSGGNTERNRAGETDKIDKFEKILEEKEMPIDFLKTQVEKADRSRYDICEICSPPRVCVVATDTDSKEGGHLMLAPVILSLGNVTT